MRSISRGEFPAPRALTKRMTDQLPLFSDLGGRSNRSFRPAALQVSGSQEMNDLANQSLLALGRSTQYQTLLADPPWRFQNRTGKMAPEHVRLARYATMTLDEIEALPVPDVSADTAHLYLWVPNALLAEGMRVLMAWGFTYKTNLVWFKTRKDGGPDGRGVGFYFRNVTELVLFGVRGSCRTLAPGRRQVNLFDERKREHSRKPERLYDIVESCSPGPYLELFARHPRQGWHQWGDAVRRSGASPLDEADRRAS